ncbi:hypothetical protein J4474_04050 [Candidatus Pacearchaeota archaeon]|nr:hypothetical protein [Candidatus Pacearchaeota archaeon]
MVIRNKFGQLKIQQMAFMLIAVTLFFVLVGMFVLVYKFSDIKNQANTLREQNAMLLATKIANSPEFSCGMALGSGKTNCVDADKIIALKNNIKKYEDFWGSNTNVVVKTIYPKEKEKECTFANYPDCNVINLLGKNISGTYSNFVSVCKKENENGIIYDKCELGRIIVSYENQF